jgi:glycosyltransferase involved in cell wall biosynthesis
MSDLPRITIVMPSLNQSGYIEESIQSILDQHYPNLELLILDGGSTDGSQEKIKSYSNHLVYWHSHRDAGQTDALIQGFSRATGELMGWLNSDDILLPGALFQVAQAFKSHPKGDIFTGNILIIDENGKIIRCLRTPLTATLYARYGYFAMAQPGSFFTRKEYEAVGGLHIELNSIMDADLYFRMLNNHAQYVKINAWLSGFRLHPLSKTVLQRSKSETEFELARHKYLPWVKPSRVGRYLYVCIQMLNGNYLRMIIDTYLARGMNWRKWWERNYVVQNEDW